MARLNVKTLSGMMLYTGDSCNTNASAIAARKYGFEDDNIGVLTHLSDGNINWTKYSSYIYSENDTTISSKNDIINNAYSYVITLDGLNGDMYLYNNDFSEIYSYEYQLNSSLVEAVDKPVEDLNTFLASLNNSAFNKQKYYNGVPEVESIVFAGLRYDWQPAGTKLNNTWTGESYNVGNQYIRYNSIEHTAYTMSYNTTTSEWEYDYDENDKRISYTVYDIQNIATVADKLKEKHNDIIDSFKTAYNIYDEEPLYAYYISNADTKYKFILNTYSLATQIINTYVNYDGEYNDWFNNVITFSINPDKLNSYNELYTINGDNYIYGTRYNTYVDISYGNVELSYDKTYTFTLSYANIENDTKLSIMSPYKLNELDFSPISTALTYSIDFDHHYNMNVNCDVTEDTTWHTRRGCQIKKLVVGDYNGSTYSNCGITELNGLSYLKSLEYLDISGCNKLLKTPNINCFDKLSTFIACGSNIESFAPSANKAFDTVILPNTIKAINITGNTIEHFNYSPNDKLVSLTFDNATIKNIDTYDIVKDWVMSLASSNLIYDGLVNYTKLCNVNWTNADVNVVLMLQYLGLEEFTGNIKLIGSLENNGKLTRNEYWNIVKSYGQDTVKGTNDKLKFTYELVNGTYKITMRIAQEDSYKDIIVSLDDKESTNTLIDMLAITNATFTKNNSAMVYELPEEIAEDDTYYPNTIKAGDVMLYKGKYIYAFFEDATNIVNNYIKLGTITNITDFVNICEEDTFTCSLYDNTIVYVDTVKFDKHNIEVQYSASDKLNMVNIVLTVGPDDATNRNIQVSYDDEYISSVLTNDNLLGVVLTGKTGTTELTITSMDKSNISDTCEIKISAKEGI